jgi:hypothetical protein
VTARLFGFHTALAHGKWLKARVLAGLSNRVSPAVDVDIVFKTPVSLPGDGRAETRPSVSEWRIDVRDHRTGASHLTGTITMLRAKNSQRPNGTGASCWFFVRRTCSGH